MWRNIWRVAIIYHPTQKKNYLFVETALKIFKSSMEYSEVSVSWCYGVWKFPNFWRASVRRYTFEVVSSHPVLWLKVRMPTLCFMHTTCLAHLHYRFYHPNEVWGRMQNMKLLSRQFSPVSSYIPSLCSKYSHYRLHQHPVTVNIQSLN